MAQQTASMAAELRRTFGGQIVAPGDTDYDDARQIWNGMIDRHPALIARCTTTQDVVAAVNFGRERELVIAVRGGGHNVSGSALCDDGIVIDLSGLRGLDVDPDQRTATVGGGVLLGELDAAAQVHGLATSSGVVTHTGVAGLTLGGGIGNLMRKHGLACDNLLEVEMVTAGGQLVRASEGENADLFWGLRGGGGNFGVVTSFKFRLHPVGPMVVAGMVLHRADRAREVLSFYQDFIDHAPDELGSLISLRTAPALPFIPDHLHGQPVVALIPCYLGPPEEADRVLRPLREFGPPAAYLVSARPFLEHQSMLDASVPHGWRYYWKSHYLTRFSDAAIDVLAETAWTKRSPRSYVVIFQMGGAVAGVADDSTAFSGREAAHAININAAWTADEEASFNDTEWARTMFEAVTPFATGVYVNFLGNEGQERVRAAYGAAKYDRLAQLKALWDPNNLFHMNQNILPAR